MIEMEALKRVAVIGAAGKMGSGISALLLQEMARSEAHAKGLVGSGEYILTLIDSNEKNLFDLRHYLRAQLTRYAEKNINELRQYFKNNLTLISNEEIIDAFVAGATDIAFFGTSSSLAKDSVLVFEAIVEDVSTKTKVLQELKQTSNKQQYYFSNTSSIPISLLDSNAQLDHHIIGFHFYNPPIVQKLIELIVPVTIDPKLELLGLELIKRLKKIYVRSQDIAGFIGNGHFIREVLFACQLAKKLSQDRGWPLEKAIYLINRITQDFLIRPMGIFQLIDFVGIDVCNNITKIMSTHLPDPSLRNEWLEQMVSAGVLGGQYPDGKQHNGCFNYEQQKITGVYSLKTKSYWWEENLDQLIGPLPESHISWKRLQAEKQDSDVLKSYFRNFYNMETPTAKLAQAYLAESQRIASFLVETHVAESLQDVDTVLKNGFFISMDTRYHNLTRAYRRDFRIFSVEIYFFTTEPTENTEKREEY